MSDHAHHIRTFSTLLVGIFLANTNVESIDLRICNGNVVSITQHPHQISLRSKDIWYSEEMWDHICGGSIYSERIVITAAHCINDKVASQLEVVAGTNKLSRTAGVMVPVEEIIMHEQYSPYTQENDIALLVLAVSLPIDNYTIKSVKLTVAPPQQGNTATITGWGITESGSPSELLREVKVPIVSNEVCDLYYPGEIYESMLCAGLLGIGGKDSCYGDSGGPLLVDGKLAGVVSWGADCADPYHPGVYANVWNLRSWLKENIEGVEIVSVE